MESHLQNISYSNSSSLVSGGDNESLDLELPGGWACVDGRPLRSVSLAEEEGVMVEKPPRESQARSCSLARR